MSNGHRIVFAADHPGATLSRRVSRGELVPLARGIYTTETETPPERVVIREWRSVLIKALRFLHDDTARIPWSSQEAAHQALHATNAFDDDLDARLELPDRV